MEKLISVYCGSVQKIYAGTVDKLKNQMYRLIHNAVVDVGATGFVDSLSISNALNGSSTPLDISNGNVSVYVTENYASVQTDEENYFFEIGQIAEVFL